MDISPLLFSLFAGATLVQLTYWLGIFARLAWHKNAAKARQQEEANDATQAPPVSVLICARNEAENLKSYLPAVLEQQYPDFEVLVIDDDSEDDTPAILAAFQEKFRHLRVLRLSPKTTPGKKHALAQGIDAARYEHLLFTDADCRPASPFWLRQMAGYFAHSALRTPHSALRIPEIVLGYAPHRSTPGFLNRCIRFETVYTAMQYFSFALVGQPYMGVGRNLAWQKKIYRRTGGFTRHAHLPSGDDDLLVNAAAQAGNTAVCLAPESFVYSDGAGSWADWFRQKRRHLGAGVYYRPVHQLLLGGLAISQILHYFLIIPLQFTDFGTICVAFYALRMVSAIIIYSKILRQFHDERLLFWFPLLDALLAFYSSVFVPLVFFRFNYLISWK